MTEAADHRARRGLTFEQAEGLAPLPSQLKLGELSGQLRALLWRVIYGSIDAEKVNSNYGGGPYLGSDWKALLYDYETLHRHRPADEVSSKVADHLTTLKLLVFERPYAEVLGFVQFVAQRCRKPLREDLAVALEHARAAYRLHSDGTVLPFASEEEGAALLTALEAVNGAAFKGPRAHLLNAAAAATSGSYAECVRESIHAVEAAARILEPSADTLGPALKKLGKAAYIHPALERGFLSLYGYTSDEGGVRHALLDADRPNVDEADAIYMLGSCAAFVTYLVRKTGSAR